MQQTQMAQRSTVQKQGKIWNAEQHTTSTFVSRTSHAVSQCRLPGAPSCKEAAALVCLQVLVELPNAHCYITRAVSLPQLARPAAAVCAPPAQRGGKQERGEEELGGAMSQQIAHAPCT